jgi:hypothetical protein
METNETPKWKYFIPFYGIYATYKSETPGKGKWWVVSILVTLIFVSLFNDKKKESTESASSSSSPTETTSQLSPVIPSSSDTSVEPPKEEPAKFYQIGQSVKTNKFELSIPSTRSTMNIGSGFGAETPAQGGFFLIIKFKYKNISSAPIGSFETPSFELYDPSGNQVEEAISAAFQLALEDPSGKKLASNLNPGISITESKVFEVSNEYWKGGKNWVIILDADEKISFKVK